MGTLDGRVAFVTGAARGQGRSHAVRLAAEGADIIAVDIHTGVETTPYPVSTADDLAETARQVAAHGRRVIAEDADIRDFDRLSSVLNDGVMKLGRLDIVIANAGIFSFSSVADMPLRQWNEMIDVNLSGAFHTCKASLPHLLKTGDGGAVVLTSSKLGLEPKANLAHYCAAKHGVIGLTQALAVELAPHGIRVNCVCPCTVNTPMVMNESTYRLFRPDLEEPQQADLAPLLASTTALKVPWIEPGDVSDAVAFLVSSEARYITGVAFPVDAGGMLV
jgi:(+)-trans-carveol dehydrogenase